jgi:hypothetical protein
VNYLSNNLSGFNKTVLLEGLFLQTTTEQVMCNKKHGKNYGITLYVPKETIFKDVAA